MADRSDIALGDTVDQTKLSTPRASAPRTRLAVGQRLAGRYEIIRFIAAGGMGEVYEARDVELDVAVALKAIRSDRADGRAEEYFRREIQLARKITHSSVCRIFDVGFDGEGERSTMFLTMELLDGETLAERIRRGGRLSVEHARPIVEQVCSALTAAHGAGIVHRDLKSQNIMLVTSPPRAVVMDFGLARPLAGRDVDAHASESGLVGTPHYMAPEQILGTPITPAADVYALGVVMYEMVTGELPFAAPTPMGVIAKRLAEPAPSPRNKVPGLESPWTTTIERCLEREPAARFTSAAEVASALARPTQRARRWIWIAVASALAAVMAWSLWPSSASVSRRSGPGTTIAVLELENATRRSDAAWLATGLGEMFASELASATVHVVPREMVARAALEIPLRPGALAVDTLGKVRADLGAELVLGGSYTVDEEGRLRVDLRLQDTRTGETTPIIATGTTRELFAMVARAGGSLRQALGVTDHADVAPTSVLPADPAAARLYAEGLSRLRTFDALGARDKLEAAVAAAPAFPLAHAALAHALGELGYERRARDEAHAALDTAGQLPPREYRRVRAQYFVTAREWSKAIDEYRALVDGDPADVEAGLGFADALAHAGDFDAAFARLATLRALPGPAGHDPRIDLAEDRAAGDHDDFHHQQTAAAAAAVRGRETGARLLVGEARLDEAWSSRRLGDHARADGALAEARAIFESLEYRRGLGRVRNHLASVLLDEGDLGGARREAEAALAIFEALGDRDGEQSEWGMLGEIQQDLGDLSSARESYTKALAAARATRNEASQAGALLNLGLVAIHLGDTKAARSMIDEALPRFRTDGAHYPEGLALAALGDIARIDGDLAAARARYADAFATLRTAGNRPEAADVQLNSASLARITGDIEDTRRLVAEARAEGEKLHLDGILGRADLEFAQVAADETKPDEAARDARASADRFEKAGVRDQEGRARAVLAVALVDAGHVSDGTTALARATKLAQGSQDRLLRIEVALATARVDAGTGHAARALLELHQIVAASDTPLEQRLEARLSEARLTASRAALDAVAHDATAAGFATIADAARHR